MTCHRCQHALVASHSKAGLLYTCPSCSGVAVSLAVLRKHCGSGTVDALWSGLVERDADAHTDAISCSVCRRNTKRIHAGNSNTPVEVDVCVDCQFLWLDAGELAALPVRPASQTDPFVEREGERLRRRLRRERTDMSGSGWDWPDPLDIIWIIDAIIDALSL